MEVKENNLKGNDDTERPSAADAGSRKKRTTLPPYIYHCTS